MELAELDDAHSVVEMIYDPEHMGNMYDREKGGRPLLIYLSEFQTLAHHRKHITNGRSKP
jgi:hypothetical protein